MKRPALRVTTTTWAYASMEITAVTEHQSANLREIGKDIHANIRVAVNKPTPVAFFAYSSQSRVFQNLIGKIVEIEMQGIIDQKGRFRPDVLNILDVKKLKNGGFSVRTREP